MKTLIIIALLMLAPLAGCARRSDSKSSASRTLSDATSAIRVSAEGLNAAEPAIAAGRDGTAYVAWVGHGARKEADVWLTRVEGTEKRSNAERARVNRNPG